MVGAFWYKFWCILKVNSIEPEYPPFLITHSIVISLIFLKKDCSINVVTYYASSTFDWVTKIPNHRMLENQNTSFDSCF